MRADSQLIHVLPAATTAHLIYLQIYLQVVLELI